MYTVLKWHYKSIYSNFIKVKLTYLCKFFSQSRQKFSKIRDRTKKCKIKRNGYIVWVLSKEPSGAVHDTHGLSGWAAKGRDSTHLPLLKQGL